MFCFFLSPQFRSGSVFCFFLVFLSSPRPSVVYPGPSGHIFLYCTVPGSGHSSHREPQPRPMLQQHSDLVTLFLLVDDCWHMVCRTSVKQKPFLLSGGKNTKKKKSNITFTFYCSKTCGCDTFSSANQSGFSYRYIPFQWGSAQILRCSRSGNFPPC